MNVDTIGRVYLVGAGCGEADLITVRGASLLRRCDAVVYDDLIDPALLLQTPSHAEWYYMGKRSGGHSACQNQICQRLIQLAGEGKTVVRLKGGDPYVFGRGGEEMLALAEAGIPCEEVPGITSAIAIPAQAGIPVTHRQISRSFHVVTAHMADTPDGLPADMEKLAHLSGTLVFLMGLALLPRLSERLLAAGMDPAVPAAVVSGGNAPHPAIVRGTLADIARRTTEAGVSAPAVILVGATAAMDLRGTISRPLDGVCVGLTGTSAVTDELDRGLRAMGARTFCAARSEVNVLTTPLPLDTFTDGGTHWLVFTSRNGVDTFFRRLTGAGVDIRTLHSCRFAVIGASTAEALRAHGVHADLCPETYTSEELGKALIRSVQPNEDVFLLRSCLGSPQLLHMLEDRVSVRDIPLYDLAADRRAATAAGQYMPAADYLTFSSASGVAFFFETYGSIPARAVCVCIGPVTAKALAARYDRPFLTANGISAESIIQTIAEHHQHRGQQE